VDVSGDSDPVFYGAVSTETNSKARASDKDMVVLILMLRIEYAPIIGR